MFEPSRAHDTIRSSTATGYPARFKRLESVIGIWLDSAACGMRVVTRSILLGEMPAFAASLTTCRHRNFRRLWIELIELAKKRRTAIMCAEAVPWRCHRSLIGDALLVRGVRVEEIASPTRTRPHILTPWARVRRKRLSYPANPEDTKTCGREGHLTLLRYSGVVSISAALAILVRHDLGGGGG